MLLSSIEKRKGLYPPIQFILTVAFFYSFYLHFCLLAFTSFHSSLNFFEGPQGTSPGYLPLSVGLIIIQGCHPHQPYFCCQAWLDLVYSRILYLDWFQICLTSFLNVSLVSADITYLFALFIIMILLCVLIAVWYLLFVQQNVRIDQRASLNDGQGDWLDVQTLYASGRYTRQHRTSQPFVRE